MASAAPKPCAHSGCPSLSYDDSGRCPTHQRTEGKFADPYRGSRHERGYGSEWDKKRRQILERDHRLCQPCLRVGLIAAARQVDHIVPKESGGTDDDENLQSICIPCHKAKTALEGALGRARARE